MCRPCTRACRLRRARARTPDRWRTAASSWRCPVERGSANRKAGLGNTRPSRNGPHAGKPTSAHRRHSRRGMPHTSAGRPYRSKKAAPCCTSPGRRSSHAACDRRPPHTPSPAVCRVDRRGRSRGARCRIRARTSLPAHQHSTAARPCRRSSRRRRSVAMTRARRERPPRGWSVRPGVWRRSVPAGQRIGNTTRNRPCTACRRT